MNSARQAPDMFDLAARDWLSRRDKKGPKLYIERDDGIKYEGPFEYYLYKGPESIQDYEEGLLHYLRSPILDLGCGAGRFAIPLSQFGYSVVGIDVSPNALKIGRMSAGHRASMVQMSLDQLGFTRDAFSSVIGMGYNVGAAGNLERLGCLFHHLKRICAPGGHFILTSIDVTKRWDYQRYFLERFSKGREMGQSKVRLWLGDAAGDWFDWLYVSPGDLERTAGEHGWKMLEIIYSAAEPDAYAAVLENER